MKVRCNDRTLWVCSRDKNRCRMRIYSSGNTVTLKGGYHSHQATFTGSTDTFKSQVALLETIHFRMTKKDPIMIRNSFEYRYRLKKPYGNKSL
ncbi:hypothetical protein HUJ05_001590 [Dendroctonus ponderosae]|nr:hypothetical protein HUJ05_001590 [Dendroctonus ponderosae]